MFSIVIPAHNEATRIGKTLREYTKIKDAEIIVVLNGCTDNTEKVVVNFDVKILEFRKKLGKGRAIIEGFKVAKGEIIVFADTDGSVPSEELLKVVNYAKKYDVTICSRWLKESIIPVKQPLLRRIASRAFNAAVRIILGLKFHDTQCGCKAFKRDVVYAINDIKTGGYAFDVDLLYNLKKKGYNIHEVPITWIDRKGSKLKLIDVFEMFISLFKIRFS